MNIVRFQQYSGTPLHGAMHGQRIETIMYLIEREAELEARDHVSRKYNNSFNAQQC